MKLVLALLLALPCAGFAQSRTVSYSILKEGDPIGKEIYDITQDGDQITVKLVVDSKVRILFLDFHYHHERSESWDGDKLVKLVADTDDDGTKHHVEATNTDGKLSVTSDGKALQVAADAFPLAMWRKAIVGHNDLFAVESDDKPYKVTIKDVGPESVEIGGQKIACEHYAMTGDVDRDLWYDPDGMLAKVSFRRRGFGISLLRDS